MHRQFYHRACANGISATIQRPILEHIHVRPMSSLPSSGGFGVHREERFNIHDLISFDRAYTQVSGDFTDEVEEPPSGSKEAPKPVRIHHNLALSAIEGLSLFHVIKIDRLVARLTTRHADYSGEPEIVPVGSQIEGFRIGGKNIEINFATDFFTKYSTLASLEEAYKEEAFRKTFCELQGWDRLKEPGKDGDKAARLFNDDTNWLRSHCSEKLPIWTDRLHVSLVESIIIPKGSELMASGNVLVIPHVGKLFFGEMVISREFKRLTMMRFEFGSPEAGSGSAGGTDSGGGMGS